MKNSEITTLRIDRRENAGRPMRGKMRKSGALQISDGRAYRPLGWAGPKIGIGTPVTWRGSASINARYFRDAFPNAR